MGPRSPLRFGRCRADVPRTSCNPSSARLRLLRGRRPWFKVSPPARSARGMRSPGPHSVSAPLRSLQNRRPPDVLQPIFRKTMVVVEQAPWVQSLRSASVGAEQTSPGCLAVYAPLRSLQNRRPPDVLQPIFRKAPVVVVEQAPYIE